MSKENDRGSSSGRRYKRPFDLAILGVSHVVFAPVLALLWAVIPPLVWLGDRGPILFRQQRIGKDGRIFTFVKFRTMEPDAESRGPSWTSRDDPRVTRVGRILRRTALDELPQLINILKGEMSWVGPRALPLGMHEDALKEEPRFAQRLAVPPGLTGVAQVYNRDDHVPAKLIYDLDYVENMSPWLDLKLIVLSLRNTLLAKWDTRSGKSLSQS